MPSPPRLLYTSFDEVPSRKGASTHIEAFSQALGRKFGSLILVTPGPRDLPVREFAPGVRQLVLGCPDDNPIGRARIFRNKLVGLLRGQLFDLIHFRSVFEGYPIASCLDFHGAQLLYEANGFPSIEMKYHHRNLVGDTVLQNKLWQQEQTCLEAADRIVTVSQVTQQYIVGRGIPSTKVEVIPNGFDFQEFPYREPPPADRPFRIAYVGTLTAWQGVETLLRAVQLLARDEPVDLRLASPLPKRRVTMLRRLATELKIESAVHFLGPLNRSLIARVLHSAHATVVPLAPVDRNTRQGCCPLKMLEAMAAGCPVVASDLPVVRELAEPENHFVPARPGNPKSLKDALLRLVRSPDLGRRISRQARAHVETRFPWNRMTQRLIRVYEDLLSNSPRISANRPDSAARA